jgi:protein phosphatase
MASKILDNQGKHTDVEGKLVKLPQSGEVLVIGDLHGDLKSLNRIVKGENLEKRLDKGNFFLICLGDYIDRGPHQIQVLHRLLNYLISFPSQVILLRGNHEGPAGIKISPHDFPHQLAHHFGHEWKTIYIAYRRLFDNLNTACIIPGKALLLHGGIPSKTNSLNDIAYAHDNHPQQSNLEEILWNDPSTLPGINYSFRGYGKQFGIDITNSFLGKLGVETLIRGHECFDEGFYFHDGRILTLFSCRLPHYRNEKLAYIHIPLESDFDRDTLERHIYQL